MVLASLVQALDSDDLDVRLDAVEQIAEHIGEAFGAQGAALGSTLRDSGIVERLARLVGDPSQTIKCHALLALGNLCSDAVDSHSSRTKALLLELGMDGALMDCVASTEPSVLLVACATLQNLCHNPAWAARVLADGVEKRMEALLTHEDPRIVRYASGALKNLTLSADSAAQLSESATAHVQQRVQEATVEVFMQRRALRTIGRAALRMDPEQRLACLLTIPHERRGVVWLDRVGVVHAFLELRAAEVEFRHVQAGETAPSAELLQLQRQLSAAAHAYEEALGLPEFLSEELGDDDIADWAVEGDAEEVEEEDEALRLAAAHASPAAHRPPATTLGGASSQGDLARPVVEEEVLARADTVKEDAGSEVLPEIVEEEALPVEGTASPAAPAAPASATTAAAAPRAQRSLFTVDEGSPPRAPQLSSEANRAAAEEWLIRARQLHEAGKDEAALRHCDKSLRLCDTPQARSLAEHLRRFGPSSAAAAAVAKVLQAADHWAVLQLEHSATEVEVRKAYRKLSLQLHPDRNHARQAESAFKRLNEAHTALSKVMAEAAPGAAASPMASQPHQPHHTPRPPPPRARASDEDPVSGGVPTMPRSRDANPVRRRRWQKAFASLFGTTSRSVADASSREPPPQEAKRATSTSTSSTPSGTVPGSTASTGTAT